MKQFLLALLPLSCQPALPPEKPYKIEVSAYYGSVIETGKLDEKCNPYYMVVELVNAEVTIPSSKPVDELAGKTTIITVLEKTSGKQKCPEITIRGGE